MRYSFLPFSLAGLFLFTVVGCVNQPLLLRNRPNVPPPLLAPSSQSVDGDSYNTVVEQVPETLVLPVPVIKAPPITYTVVKRDSFWKIARKFGVDKSELAACNNMSLDKPLKVGVVLVIPPGAVKGGKTKTFSSTWKTKSVVRSGKTKPVSSVERGGGAPAPNDGTYVVRPKDSIWKISRRFGLTTKELVAANDLDPRKPIKPGMKLIIPEGKDDASTKGRDTTSNSEQTAPENSSSVPEADSASNSVSDMKTVDETDSSDGKNLLDDAVESVESKKSNDAKKKKSIDDILDELDSSSVDVNRSSELPGAPYTEEVIPNETLQEIADRNGCTVEEILKANPNIKSEDDVKPFTSIIIPKK
ncbi:MAG: LysM peptidoglycan-binding domain-containing protein [Kiritimatiellaeota bacterium]|nr:LysM peptidoglycan-binding domain-containing protein [Kiritimatiellota bacterium]